ncbi:ribonuclease domain-containing protein [Streptomyces catenulae]|uniref:Ribonuclease domain-containing protein n=1 Tax=Streptomyces catenulae TaxID=66875 RepID=A0ABV2YX25_9ACTN|nr:ribonuclease domain-containing protein [Streptomyces catenulae]
MKIRFSVRPAATALAALLSGLLLVLTGCGPGHGSAASPGPSATRTAASRPAGAPGWAHGMATVTERELPHEARETLRLIDAGGPYPYRKDGTVFGNYEKRLPGQARGYYHEFTVPTPGARDRGARRLITGQHHETFYTADHYRSFKAVLR